MKPLHTFLLLFSTGILLSLAWIPGFSGVFLFVALLPLLYVENHFFVNKETLKARRFFWLVFLSFIVWNTITTYWIKNATVFGAVVAILLNSFLSTVVVWLAHITKRRLGLRLGNLSLVVFWITWEFFYHNAEISWPWLALGNGFANDIRLIQWYEFTGAFGGTLWALAINLMIFETYRLYKNQQKNIVLPIVIAVTIMVPIIFSLCRFYSYHEKKDPVQVVVVQPNIDPYNEKFSSMSVEQQLQKMLDLAFQKIDDSTDYVVFPETALDNGIWVHDIENNNTVRAIKQTFQAFPNLRLITGVDIFKLYLPGDTLTVTVRKLNDTLFYDVANAAIQVSQNEKTSIYFKSKLVVGVEKLPYPQYMGFLEDIAPNLGGAFGSRATQPERAVFTNSLDDAAIAPVICYESIYGEYFTNYIKKGANLIFVITNDGWWGNTPGYHQHLSYSSLRAIETRRSIARSANTGVSAFINQRGEILNPTKWWVPDVIKSEINKNDVITFYVKHGDYIGRTALFLSIIIFILLIINKFAPLQRLKK